MTIQSLQTTDFRNLKSRPLQFDDSLNIVAGPNGSGKTSLLEAIYLLTSGRSFRTNKLDSIICRTSPGSGESFVLFGSILDRSRTLSTLGISENTIGLKKVRQANTQIKIDGASVQSAALLAKLCPVVLLEPGNLALLTGTTQSRRKYLDWSVFHVEHKFSKLWKEFRYCLKQRNALLRQAKGLRDVTGSKLANQFTVWNQQLERLANEIDSLRKTQFELIQGCFNQTISELLNEKDIQLQYRPGWDTSVPFSEAMTRVFSNDTIKGHTSVGPHRMDVRITVQNKPVVELLSRGQLKLVSAALYLAQVRALKSSTGKKSVVLLDDVSAELDAHNTERIFTTLRALQSQVICTTLDSVRTKNAVGQNNKFKMFHVEHGVITDE